MSFTTLSLSAPILFCKACESALISLSSIHPNSGSLIFVVSKKVFIAEITARAFIVADSNKRRTLSRADIAKALSKSDQFDFLIDIVPRDEPFVPGVTGPGKNAAKKPVPGAVSMRRDPVRDVAMASTKVLTLIAPPKPKKAAQDAQGEAQGDPSLDGGESASVDGLPHSGVLEQVSKQPSLLHVTPQTRHVVPFF